jgi:hypothetical protein
LPGACRENFMRVLPLQLTAQFFNEYYGRT